MPALIRHFAKQFALANSPAIEFSEGFLSVMQSYDWPGNVRELSNMVHRLTVLYPGQTLQMNHVAPSMLPAGMAELICEESSDEQASLFDVFSDEPLGSRPFRRKAMLSP